MIDLRGGQQNPWAQFLPMLAQKMMLMKMESKFKMEELKVKATNDAAKLKEGREYEEKTKLVDKGFTEAPKEFSEDYRLLGQSTGMPTKQVGDKTMIPPTQPGADYEYNTSENKWVYRKPEKVGKPTPSRRYILGDTIYKEVGGKLVPEITKSKAEVAGKTPEFKQKIETLMTTMGVDEKIATGIILGTDKVQKDPVTGEVTIVNLLNKTVTKPTIADSQPERKASTQKGNISIWDLAEDVAGPVSAAKAAGSVISGMVGGPVAGKTIEARQTVTNAQNDLVRALSINPRFPVGEINRIREEINIAPKIFDNPEVYRNRLKAIDKYLRNRVINEQRDSVNPNLPVDQRRAARQAGGDILDFIDMLGVPGEKSTIPMKDAADALIEKYGKKK